MRLAYRKLMSWLLVWTALWILVAVCLKAFFVESSMVFGMVNLVVLEARYGEISQKPFRLLIRVLISTLFVYGAGGIVFEALCRISKPVGITHTMTSGVCRGRHVDVGTLIFAATCTVVGSVAFGLATIYYNRWLSQVSHKDS